MTDRGLAPQSLKFMASKVTFVSFDVIQFRENEMRSHWYRYEDIDLYYFQTLDGKIAKIHVSLFGQVIEWNPYDGLRTGLLVESENEGGASEVVQYDARANRTTVAQAIEVLEHASRIELDQREILLGCLRKPEALSFSFFKKILKLFF